MPVLPRQSTIERTTKETQVLVEMCLDGSGQGTLDVGVPFLEHMLDQLKTHGRLNLSIKATGDLEVDYHHTVEDIGITLGQCFREALGDKGGIHRYGHALVPLDEALSRAVIDFSGRPGLEYHVRYPRARIGDFDVDLLHEFFQGFVNHAQATLHIDTIRGSNSHHIAETIFKAFARAVRAAVAIDPTLEGHIPSSKKTL